MNEETLQNLREAADYLRHIGSETYAAAAFAAIRFVEATRGVDVVPPTFVRPPAHPPEFDPQ